MVGRLIPAGSVRAPAGFEGEREVELLLGERERVVVMGGRALAIRLEGFRGGREVLVLGAGRGTAGLNR